MGRGHSRVEESTHYSVPLPKDLESEDWVGLTSLVMVVSERTVNDKTSTDVRYFIASLPAQSIENLAKAIREHWQVKNSLDWRLTVSFNEDRWHSKIMLRRIWR